MLKPLVGGALIACCPEVFGDQTLEGSASCDSSQPPPLELAVPPQLWKWNIEELCPKAANGRLHDEMCSDCKALGDGQTKFAVCIGCEGVDQDAVCVDIANVISSNIVEVKPESERRLATPVSRHLSTANQTSFEASCKIDPSGGSVAIAQAAVVRYDCQSCLDTDVPRLLWQCCDACLAWGDIQKESGSFTYCNGCMGLDEENYANAKKHVDESQAKENLQLYIDAKACQVSAAIISCPHLVMFLAVILSAHGA